MAWKNIIEIPGFDPAGAFVEDENGDLVSISLSDSYYLTVDGEELRGGTPEGYEGYGIYVPVPGQYSKFRITTVGYSDTGGLSEFVFSIIDNEYNEIAYGGSRTSGGFPPPTELDDPDQEATYLYFRAYGDGRAWGEFSVIVEVDGQSGGGGGGGCFWTDIVNATQVCGEPEPETNNQSVDYRLYDRYSAWTSGEWSGAELWAPPELPLTYPDPVTIPLPAPSSFVARASRSDYNHHDVTPSVTWTDGSLSCAPVYCEPWWGQSNRTLGIYLYDIEWLPGKIELDSDFITDISLYVPEGSNSPHGYSGGGAFSRMYAVPYHDEPAQVVLASAGGTGSVALPGTSASLTLYLSSGAVAQYSGSLQASGNYTLDGMDTWYPYLYADGYMQFNDNYFFASAAVAVDAGYLGFSVTGLTLSISPLRKIVGYLDNVELFTAEQLVEADCTNFQAPPAGTGQGVFSKRVPIYDASTPWGDEGYALDTAYLVEELPLPWGDNGYYVGDLYDINNPDTPVAKVMVGRRL